MFKPDCLKLQASPTAVNTRVDCFILCCAFGLNARLPEEHQEYRSRSTLPMDAASPRAWLKWPAIQKNPWMVPEY